MASVIAETATRLLDGIDPTQPVDMSTRFGMMFAPEIMAEFIGLPADDRERVSELTAVQMRGSDPAASFETRLASELAAREQRSYVQQIIADRREAPRDDLVTELVRSSGDMLSEAELIQLITILYIGGYETTSHMIGNGLVALLNAPDQLALLKEDVDARIRPAVEEILRYDSAISATQVYPAPGVTLLGKPTSAEQPYLGLLTAANRDPTVYESPDAFLIDRERKPIQAFGGGPHFCLGMNLARLELTIVFKELLRRFPDMQLLEADPPRSGNFHQQSYQRVPVLLRPPRVAA